jgi:hypothetical protein
MRKVQRAKRLVARAWLAGILEGEASFGWEKASYRGRPSNNYEGKTVYRRPVIQLGMTYRDIIERAGEVAELFCGHRAGITSRTRPPLPTMLGTYKPTHTVRWSGNTALLLMQAMRPLMGDRRGNKIDELLNRRIQDRRIKFRQKINREDKSCSK